MSEERSRPAGAGGGERLDSDLDIRRILGFAIALAVVCAAVAALMWGFSLRLRSDISGRDPAAPPVPEARTPPAPPEPRLQTAPVEDLRRLRAEEEELLTGYAWVDREEGVIRIPIDEAKELLLQRGLPSRQDPPSPATEPSGPGSEKEDAP